MTLVGLDWSADFGDDVHLLPGLRSPWLTPFLFAAIQDPASGVVDHQAATTVAGLTVTYSAKFDGAPGPKHGVVLNQTTGEVTVAGILPPVGQRLRSFVVTAKAQLGAESATARIRVYVHDSVDHMWLTPSMLTLRKSASNVRLTVLARFDDGTIGDLSGWSPNQPFAPGEVPRHVHNVTSDTPLLIWSPEGIPPGSPAKVTVQPHTGVLHTVEDAGEAKIIVTRGTQTAEAVVVCAKPWTTPVRLTQVVAPGTDAGLTGPGVAGIHAVPNILFLPDGFRETERGEFERLVRGAVARLTARNRTKPFSYLRMNYWMAWLGSRDDGVSVLNEFHRSGAGPLPGEDTVIPVELPSVESPVLNWELADLIHEVGLATPAYDPPNSTLADKILEWQTVYGLHITAGRMQHLFNDWLARGTRRLANERDTAFHMAFGERPRVPFVLVARHLTPHPRRLDPNDFNAFLNALEGPDGQVLPDVWTSGKDNDLVVVLCRSRRIGGANVDRTGTPANPAKTITTSLGEHGHHVVKLVGADGFDVVGDEIPATVNYSIWLTAAHELAHSWTLGDEYGEFPRIPTAAELQNLSGFANLQALGTLLDPGGQLVADNIRWGRWPRIVKAGVLRAALQPVLVDRFRIPLRSNRRAGFVVGDIVRLRTRPLPAATGTSGRFEVIAVDGNDVTISPLPGTVADPATLAGLFPPPAPGVPGSILIAPARAPDPDPAAGTYGDDLTMVTDAVRQRITLTHNPLNAEPLAGEAAPPNDPAGRACSNVILGIPTAATNFPNRSAPVPPRFDSWTIGLYENGGRFTCGVYRPTGVCLMNTLAQPGPGRELFMYEFCLVCRYAIVDLVDPTRHGYVNADYRERYET